MIVFTTTTASNTTKPRKTFLGFLRTVRGLIGMLESPSQSEWGYGMQNMDKGLGKGSKIKLIIFAEFSGKGGGVPPIRENN